MASSSRGGPSSRGGASSGGTPSSHGDEELDIGAIDELVTQFAKDVDPAMMADMMRYHALCNAPENTAIVRRP